VIIEELDAALEWNRKRGLVESYDAAKGRYQLLAKGRAKTLGVKVACCKLEFAVEQEQQERQATRRARVDSLGSEGALSRRLFANHPRHN
jgi:hypothetical protein